MDAAAARSIYGRYVMASALGRDADAVAALFCPDGVLESPLVPAGTSYPRRLEGREEIRHGLTAWYAGHPAAGAAVDRERSRFALHTVTEPGVFVVEIDAVTDDRTGPTTMSLVQIFRIRDGGIALLRDYFDPATVA